MRGTSDSLVSASTTDAASTTPPIRHAQIGAAYGRTAQSHHEHIQHLLQSLSLQHKALQIASNNLDFHILAISDTFDGIALNGRRELEKQASLLDGLDADLELISHVTVHVDFCSLAVRTSIENGDPHRVLADYVSKPKMKQVADACARTHGECLTALSCPFRDSIRPDTFSMRQMNCKFGLRRSKKRSED